MLSLNFTMRTWPIKFAAPESISTVTMERPSECLMRSTVLLGAAAVIAESLSFVLYAFHDGSLGLIELHQFLMLVSGAGFHTVNFPLRLHKC